MFRHFSFAPLLLCTLAVLSLHAQAPDTLWTKTYGGAGNDVGNSIKQTLDGGYIIAGSTESFGAGGQDVWLLKTNANGDTVWTKTYGGVYDDWAEDIEQTTDGGYIIAANTNSYGAGGGDIWLIKTDSLGGIMWARFHGDGVNDRCYAVQQTSDGGYIIAGHVQGLAEWIHLVLKTDANGDTSWVNYIEGFGMGECYSVSQILDGSYIVAGYWDHGQSITYPLLVKMDANGDTVWCRIYSEYAPSGGFRDVKQTADSGYVACGNFYDPGFGFCIVRTDALGNTLWTEEYGYPGNGLHVCSVQLTNDNGYIFVGGEGGYWVPGDHLILLKTNENGDSLWCSVYGDSGCPDRGNEVLQTNDGGYVVVGFTESYGAGGSDVWIIKTEPDIGIEEQPIVKSIQEEKFITTTIFRGPLQLPEGRKCSVFDITGRVVMPDKIKTGIYFIEIDGQITQKVIKIR